MRTEKTVLSQFIYIFSGFLKNFHVHNETGEGNKRFFFVLDVRAVGFTDIQTHKNKQLILFYRK